MTNSSFISLEQYKSEFDNVMSSYKDMIKCPEYENVRSHLHYAEMMDKIENRPTYILDLYKNEFFFVSKRYLYLLGIKNLQEVDYNLFFMNVHPDDYLINIQSPSGFIRIFIDSAPEVRHNLKLISDYRLKMASGYYCRVSEQIIVLETDSEGHPWLVLAICDISKDQNIERKSGAVIINFESQQIIAEFGDTNSLIANKILTAREIEILRFIAKGYSSKQIADKLFISINTVNNHRRNLIAKTGCSNTFEAMKYLSDL